MTACCHGILAIAIELYKKHKVNPLGGCLPLLLQMPIFIALYQVFHPCMHWYKMISGLYGC